MQNQDFYFFANAGEGGEDKNKIKNLILVYYGIYTLPYRPLGSLIMKVYHKTEHYESNKNKTSPISPRHQPLR